MKSTEDLINKLSKAGLTGKWGEPGNLKWVRIWVRDQWQCTYCGEELLTDVIRMVSAQVDHLLPASRYPEFRDTDANYVLSCYCCNQIKRDFDPLKDHEEWKDAPLEGHRDELIEISRTHIESRREKKKQIAKKSLEIVKEYYKSQR